VRLISVNFFQVLRYVPQHCLRPPFATAFPPNSIFGGADGRAVTLLGIELGRGASGARVCECHIRGVRAAAKLIPLVQTRVQAQTQTHAEAQTVVSTTLAVSTCQQYVSAVST
jgi:hypothetical protein